RVDVAVVAGGVVGLATARELVRRRPELRIAVLEREASLGAHQTGHNSGVVHSGVFYAAGSLKARLTMRGRAALLDFCAAERLPSRPIGKLVVAPTAADLPRLDRVEARARANGVPGVARRSAAELGEILPGLRAVAALEVPSATVVDFRAVALGIAEGLRRGGTEVRPGVPVLGAERTADGWRLRTGTGDVPAGFVVNCAGLGSDLLARAMGADPRVRIVPFRGDFYELDGPSRRAVRTLVYPVPDPRFPFAGVHLTPTVDGRLVAGPNAALALARDGYRRGAFRPAEVARLVAYPGARRLLYRYPGVAAREWLRSWSPSAFLAAIRAIWPAATAGELGARRSGVRAQAVRPDGSLEEDFVLVRAPGALHVVNAPSPAATAAFAIAEEVVR
ncbi:transcriptional regulator, partial [mine drainage metagenome]